jgi:hypothetical protein
MKKLIVVKLGELCLNPSISGRSHGATRTMDDWGGGGGTIPGDRNPATKLNRPQDAEEDIWTEEG